MSMGRSTLLVQLSDLHVGGNEDGKDPIPRLAAVIEAVRSLPNAPDAVLVSGDLTDDGAEEGYRVAREMLTRLEVPLHVVPGNHDDRARLRKAFDLPGAGDEPINYSTSVGDLRLVAPRLERARAGPRSLRRRAYGLARRGTGSRTRAADGVGGAPPAAHDRNPGVGRDQPQGDRQREALGAVVNRHTQLRAIVGGHLHRVATSVLGRLSGPRGAQHLPARFAPTSSTTRSPGSTRPASRSMPCAMVGSPRRWRRSPACRLSVLRGH